jgi:putative redox protein
MAQETVIASAVAENIGNAYTTSLQSAQHLLIADEPLAKGGGDAGPTPGDLLCMSLASCKAITLRMYAQRKGWETESIKVKVSLAKDADLESGKNTFFCELTLTGNLTEEQQQRMLHIATICPIDRLLTKESEVVTTMP